jgi:ribosomal protein S18 acetylase RimI-like enzyme
MTELTLRQADAAARDILARFVWDLWARSPHNSRVRAEAAPTVDGLLAAGYTPWLLWQDGSAVGYALTQNNGDHLFIRHFVIAPEARRSGLGRRLLALVAEAHPGLPLRLDVMHGDERAMAFWTAMGFTSAASAMRRAPEPG